MNTAELTAMLARNAGPAEAPGDAGRLLLGALAAFPLLLAAVAVSLGLVPPSGWADSATGWKVGYAAVVALVGAALLRRLGRPGSSARAEALALAVLAGAVLWIGASDFSGAAAMPIEKRFWGGTAFSCPLVILALSLPVLAAALAAGQRLAPTRPGLMGASAGLFAGGVAAMAYGLACTEGALVFVAVWYSAGLVLAVLAGWVAGRFALRW